MSKAHGYPVEAIAIIGTGLRLPQANSLDEFWQHLDAGRSLIKELPEGRFDLESFLSDPSQSNNAKNVWGGFVDDADCFDASFFGISPKEASFMDPQQRFALEMAWHAIEDAGIKASDMAGSNTGVYMGVCHWDYAELLEKYYGIVDAYMPTGIAYSIIANRVSHFFDFHGPSITNDTACASSMTSIYEAVRAIQNGECDMALAGGVNLIWSQNHFSAFSKAGMLSKEGKSRAFDAGADGYVRGEGGAILLLKSLSQAQADGDNIQGIIRGVGVNHGGRTNSLTVTSPDAQSALIQSVYRSADVEVDSIHYIEAHGPGTPLGDPIEITGLKQAFAQLYEESGLDIRPDACGIGSVKTNIGHLEGAAGVAGIVKVLAALKYEKIPANVDFKSLNQMIDLQGTPFTVMDEPRLWQKTDKARRAGISSFGFGGSNAHVLIEGYDQDATTEHRHHHDMVHYIPLSARSEDRLYSYASLLLKYLDGDYNQQLNIANIAHTYQVGREDMDEGVVIKAETIQVLQEALKDFISGQENEAVIRANGVRVADKTVHDWLDGKLVSWDYYGDVDVKRISLPVYPFARDVHWMDTFAARKESRVVPHPLLHRNVSTFEYIAFETVLTGNESIWSNHHVGDIQVLPGTVYAEMIYSSVFLMTKDKGKQLTLLDMIILRPVRAGGGAVKLETRIKQAGDEIFKVRIIRREKSGEETKLVQASVQLSEHQGIAPIALEQMFEQMPFKISVQDCYQILLRSGVRHGPLFQVLKQVKGDGEQVLAQLKLPRRMVASYKSLPLHPLLLDGAIQAWVGLDVAKDRGTMVPFACDAVEVYQQCAPEMWAIVRQNAGKNTDASSLHLDITMLDKKGAVCVRFRNLVLRTMTEKTEGVGQIKDTLFVKSRWGEVLLPKQNQASKSNVRLYASSMIEAVVRRSATQLGAAYMSFPVLNNHDLSESSMQYFSFFHRELSFWMQKEATVHTDFLLVLDDEFPEVLAMPLMALLKTATLENPKLRASVIHCNKSIIADNLSNIIRSEISFSAGYREIRYDQNGKRFLRKFVADERLNREKTVSLDSKAVYWVTGGAGGLGQHFIEWLIASGAKYILLTGRNQNLSKTLQKRIEGYTSTGLTVMYHACDMSDLSNVEETVTWCEREIGAIKGIIHAAGVLDDGYIFNQDIVALESVYAPKVGGLVHLDQATSDCDLDFMVLCSSVAANFGNSGQAFYAGANAFMDGFAHYRNNSADTERKIGKTISIAWPLWLDGGMQVDDATLAAMQNRWGIRPLPSNVALSALSTILAQEVADNYTVMFGDVGNICDFLSGFGSDQYSNITDLKETDVATSLRDLKKIATMRLREIFADVLQFEPEDLRDNRKLDEYGLESISIVEATNKLEEIFGPLSKTLLFEYVDIQGLASYFAENHAESLSNQSSELSIGVEAQNATKTIQLSNTLVEDIESKPPITVKDNNNSHDIAIIGMSLKVSKADDQNEFWQILKQGMDGFEVWPESRWNHDAILHSERDVLGKTVVKTGAFLSDIDKFDPRYFRISQAEAEIMSPEVRLFLEASVHAFEDAGYSREYMQQAYDGDVAVIMGSMTNEYHLYGFQNMLMRGSRASGSYTGTVPNMVSYYYGFTGPSYFLDTMCSASSTCVHEAVHMLRAGRCKMALAGGVSLLLHPQKLIATSQEHFTTKTADVIRGYGVGADGTILGEGVGALVLKTLSDAKRDGDHIYGVIKGSGISNAGVRNGFTVPNPGQQAKAIENALVDSNIDASTIGYIEGHGSGTALGDPIEIRALTQVYGKQGLALQSCPVGTVKSNVAHLLAASGVAGLAKVLMQFKHSEIAPSLHSEQLNPDIPFEQTPFYVPQKLTPWKVKMDQNGRPIPRRAGVTSIGAGGMNSHIILEEYVVDRLSDKSKQQEDELLVLSAMNADVLNKVIDRFCKYLEEAVQVSLSDIAYTLQVGKNELPCRLTVLVHSHEDAIQKLRAYRSSKDSNSAIRYVNSILDQEPSDDMDFIEKAISQRQLNNVAEIWTEGAFVDWVRFNEGRDLRRVSLPSYPFERIHCWYQDYPDAPSVINPMGSKLKLHPFVGNNLSNLFGFRYETTFYLEEMQDYLYYFDREMQINPIISAEIALALGRIIGLNGDLTIEGLRVKSKNNWASTSKLHYRVQHISDAVVKVQAETEVENQETIWFEVIVKGNATPSHQPFDLHTALNSYQEKIGHASVYEELSKRGLVYSPYLETIDTLYRLENDSFLAQVRLNPPQQDSFKKNIQLDAAALAATCQLLEFLSPGWGFVANWSMDTAYFAKGDIAFVLLSRKGNTTYDVSFMKNNGLICATFISVAQHKDIPIEVTPPQPEQVMTEEATERENANIDLITKQLKLIAADIIKFPAADILDKEQFHDLGFDSITLTQYAQEINKTLSVDISPAIFFDCAHIEALCQHLAVRCNPTVDKGLDYQVAKPSKVILEKVPPTVDARRTIPERVIPQSNDEDAIAIIGMAGRFPGADTLDDLFDLLLAGEDLISDLPLARYQGQLRSQIVEADFVKRGGFLNGVDLFDANYFKISPFEAQRLDPQQRLLLETVIHCLDDADYDRTELPKETGVYVGVSALDYSDLLKISGAKADGYSATGNSLAMVANRVSHFLDLHGPSLAIDTACSSSLIALNQAVNALKQGSCTMAIVGGVNLCLTKEGFEGPLDAGMLSPTGRCHSFGDAADGYVRGEGVAAVLLKKYHDAVRDGDNIYGKIVGSAQNHGGHAGSLTAPNVQAQSSLIKKAIGNIDPNTISYIEAHGTGTQLGDAVEVSALKQAFETLLEQQKFDVPFVALGSIKSNIGHLEAVAGLAGVIKVLLAMQHKTLPKSLHCQNVNPHLGLAGSPFQLVDETRPWTGTIDSSGQEVPLRAGVSSFGFGGCNAHVILEQMPDTYISKRSRRHATVFNRKSYWLPEVEEVSQQPVILIPEWTEKTFEIIENRQGMRRVVLPINMEIRRLRNTDVYPFHSNNSNCAESYTSAVKHIWKQLKKLITAQTEESIFVQLLVPDISEEDGYFTGLSAMLETAAAENPKFQIQYISCDRRYTAQTLAELLEDESASNDKSIRYLEGRRFVQVWEEACPEPFTRQSFSGVTLITGGLGGVGQVIATRIAKESPSSVLILTGRSDLSDADDGFITALCAYGAKSEYYKIDIADEHALRELLTYIIGKYGGLNHILHCAGLLRDAYLLQKEESDLESVLSAKVTGTVALSKATEKMKLDSFVLFSSLAGITGNEGQIDYAAANGFMDAFASKSQGRIFSINWPYWQSGGMLMEQPGLDRLYQKMGQRPMTNEQGQNILENLSFLGWSRAAVIAGEKERIKHYFADIMKLKSTAFSNETLSSLADNSGKHTQLIVAVRKSLTRLFAKVSGLNPHDIEGDTLLEDYGIDSLMITRLNAELANIFGSLSKTLFFQYKTLHAVADYLVRDKGDACERWVDVSQNSNESLLMEPRHKQDRPDRLDNRMTMNVDTIEPVAIVGISGQYPGGNSLEGFWEALISDRNVIGEIPEERWSIDGFFESDQDSAVEQGKSYSKWGAFLDEFADFDPLFFKISPRDAAAMDPQERLFLSSSWQTMENAGYSPQRLKDHTNGQVGVFAGICKTGYALYGPYENEDGAIVRPSTSFASVANRVSHVLDLSGPSMSIDTMCSSSLFAIHEACAYLHKNKHAMAFAGGVNLYLHPSNYNELCASRMLSPDGLCKSFGDGANGFVPGEGVGCVLLKPLSTALADGDYIHAVIRGSAVNHGGHNNGYTVPNPEAQCDVVREAMRVAGVNAGEISYIEAHGTGTALGDPIEIDGLTQAFSFDTGNKNFCAIGSVKSVFGHLEAVAGIAGLTKVVLQMQRGQLTPTRHAETVNPNIEFDTTPFKLQRSLETWDNGKPRIAGISSFGAGGANAHIIIEEAPTKAFKQSSSGPESDEVIILSAKSRTRLVAQAKQLLAFLKERSAENKTPNAQETVVQALISKLSNILKVDVEDIEADEPFETLGMEPHHWIILERWLNETYAYSLQDPLFSSQSTLYDIASSISGEDTLAGRRNDLSLADIAYTLQVGRLEMEYRLAFTSKTIDELKDKLRFYLNEGHKGCSIFESEDKSVATTIKKLLGSEELDSVLLKHWGQKEYEKLLSIWVAGISVNWESLPRANKMQILPLPAYPFDNQKYWLPRTSIEQRYDELVAEIKSTTGNIDLQEADANLETGIAELLQSILADIDPDEVSDEYKAWYASVLDLTTVDGDVKSIEEAWEDWYSFKVNNAINLSRIQLAEIVFRDLRFVLKGQKKATDVLFPDGSLKAVEAVYKENPIAVRFSKNTAKGVVSFVRNRIKKSPQEKIKILEIGAGTGGTSQFIFDALRPYENNIDCYCYTDVSRAFLIHAEHQFSSKVPYLKTAIFDVEKNPVANEFSFANYDLVVAANVLHATVDIINTLKNVRQTIKSNGVLLLNETSKATLFTHLTFGLLDGWWLSTDSERRIAGTPSLTSASWSAAMQQTGFECMAQSCTAEQALGQQIIAARAIGEVNKPPYVAPPQLTQAESLVAETHNAGTVENILKASLARTLNMPEVKIGTEQAFADLGLDSILGAEWVRRIRSELDIKLDQTLLYDFTNLKELITFVEKAWPDMCVKTDAQKQFKSGTVESQANVAESLGARKNLSASSKTLSKKQIKREVIAIVGMSGRFAGSDNIAELWDHLMAGNDLVQSVSRFNLSDYYKGAPQGSYGDKGSFLKRVDTFDAVFFGISGIEATYMDPQQRLFLEEAWKTLEHAGHAGDEIIGSECGVFVGCSHGDYHELFDDDVPGQAFWGNTSSLIPARISYWLDLKGPAVAIDTACSSSLVAVHTACRSIWDGECNMALAGGVFIQSTPRFYRSANKAQMLSPSGNCAAFGEMADGIVPGEAVASILLRPLSDALADGDTVYGVILGSGTNQDGATNGITAPSAKSQETLIRKVQSDYDIEPSSIGMVEAHGTGTPLGDPIEFNALNRVFGQNNPSGKSIFLGSIKSNIGHATTAAGICGLIRGLMSLNHGVVPPTLHATKANPSIAINKSPFVLNDRPQVWSIDEGQKRRFAINSFGFSGTNAHLVVEEPPVNVTNNINEVRPYLFILSARTSDHLRVQVENLIEHLKACKELTAGDIAYTLMVGRRHFHHRIAVLADNLSNLLQSLSSWLSNKADGHVYSAIYDPQQSRDEKGENISSDQLIEELKSNQNSTDQMRDGLIRLADFFLKGYVIHFEKLFSAQPKRVALPGYPLSTNRYWVSDLQQTASLNTYEDNEATSETNEERSFEKVKLADPLKALPETSSIATAKVSLLPLKRVICPDSGGVMMALSIEKSGSVLITRFGEGDCIDLENFKSVLQQAEKQNDIAVIVTQGLERCHSVLGADHLTLLQICKLPVVTVIEKKVSTLALSIALHADFIVMASDAKVEFVQSKAKVDNCILSCRFSKNALSILSQNRGGVTAQHLSEKGCGIKVVSEGEVHEQVMSLANLIAEAPRTSIEVLKQHFRQDMSAHSFDDSEAYEDLFSGMIEKASHQAKKWLVKEDKILLKTGLMQLSKTADGVMTLQMKDSESSNSFTDSFMDGFEEAFAEIDHHNDAKVVVLTGMDNYFAVGGTADGLKKLQKGETCFTDRKIYNLPLECNLPVIAAMQGHAVGAGWSMGMFADLTLFANEGVYHSNYMWFGFTPGAGATLALPLRLGNDLAREILFSAREYRGAELKLRAPWLKVLPSKLVCNEAKEMAHALAQYSKADLLAAKKQQSRQLRCSINEVLEQELAMHQITFVGNKRVEERIAEKFSGRMEEVTEREQVILENPDIDVHQYIFESLSKELMISIDEIREDVSFNDLGMDSILAVTWIRNLNEVFKTDIPATAVYSCPTVGEMMQKLNEYIHPIKTQKVEAETLSKSNDEEYLEYKQSGTKGDLRQLLVSSLSEVLMIEAGEIRDDMSFLELGLDSILAVTWIRRLNYMLELDLSATVVYSSPNVGKVVETIIKAMFEKATPKKQAEHIRNIQSTVTSDVALPKQHEMPIHKIQSAIEPTPEPTPEPDSSSTDIAIIGASGAFPKSESLDNYWHNLSGGVNCITTVQPDRWDIDKYYHPDETHPGTSYCKWVGRLDHIEEFDPTFFNITPREARLMDPQQRLFLQHAWHAIENAAIDPLSMAGKKCGVYASAGDSGYGTLINEKNAYSLSGNSGSILTSRISYFLDLRGPSISIDTACSSSLVGIVSACDALVDKRCDTALAGGVNVMIGPDMFIDTSKVNMLSKTGCCYTFDQRADGFVPGEGVGVVMLKRLSDALRDGDPIRAVIKGWGTNQDGRTNGITAPNPDAQAELIREIYDRFNIDAATIGMVECHGTGTPLGDPIEIEGLTDAFSGVQQHEKNCHLGSVKSNIGHLLAAAGVAGTLKGMLALENRQKPPLIHFKNCNEHIDFSKTPFKVNTELLDWSCEAERPRRVAVSSFGFSGTNAHIVMEQAPVEHLSENRSQPFLFTLSVKSEDRSETAIREMCQFVERDAELDLAAFAYSLQVGRSDFNYRIAFVYQTHAELLEFLLRAQAGQWGDDIFHTGSNIENRVFLDNDSGMNTLVETWLHSENASDLKKLAKFWVDGLSVNWQVVDKTPRIATPGYPFAKEAYWVKARNSTEKLTKMESINLSKRFPDSNNEQPESHYNVSVPVFLNGHASIVANYPGVEADHLPSLLLSELARDALQQTSGAPVVGLKNMLWGNPAPVSDLDSGLNILISRDDEGRLFRIVAKSDHTSPYHLAEEMGVDELPDCPEDISVNKVKSGKELSTELLNFTLPNTWSARGLHLVSAHKCDKYLTLHLKREKRASSPGGAGLFDVQFLSAITSIGAFAENIMNGEELMTHSLSIFSLENLVSYGSLDDEIWLRVIPGAISQGHPSNMIFYSSDKKARLMLKNLHMVPTGTNIPISLNS